MSLNVENCNRCGKIYMKNNFGVCPACIKEIELQYEKCLKFLRENRGCSMQELSEGTEVSMKQIMKFIRDGRISIKNNPNMSYECDACGSSIREGNLCDSCRSRLMKDTSDLHAQEERKRLFNEQHKATFQAKDKNER
ncbi:flagellar protein [Paenibacillus sp. KR2-11]|uniref:flagellar protein n=1 Tax=Paenibacillus sp. KR2-11 TaxID=3385500 RepID=UPI0038FBEE5B